MTSFNLTTEQRAELFEMLDEANKSDPSYTKRLCDIVIKSGEAWDSLYKVNGISTIRACITNYSISPDDVRALVNSMNKARSGL